MRKHTLEFWFEFASSYSYLTAMRIEQLASDKSVEIQWRPFLLGPIFRDQGWATTPFKLYPAKGRYMIRDIERIATDRGLTFQMPDPFPVNGLHAARLALVGLKEGWTPGFTRAVYLAEFAQGKNIADQAVLEGCLMQVGADKAAALAKSQEPAIKAALRTNTEQAAAMGIFGAPTFVTADGELFWGDDRLDDAIKWVQKTNR